MPNLTVDTQIDIAASPGAVWEVLTDFARYDQWNPFVRIEGVAQPGTRQVVRMSAKGGRGMSLRPKVLAAVPGRELRWLGSLGVRGVADGEHYFTLTANGDGTTHLDHGEQFSGALVALAKGSARRNGNDSYEVFSRALKHRVESSSRD